MSNDVGPDQILQIGFGFWPSKVLLSAVELGLFTELSGGPLSGAAIEQALGLHSRGTYDFLDTLVAIGMLERTGNGAEARYANTPTTAQFLDRNKPSYIG
ncbi:MAG TPA: methyltransferase dimerization domain-containing protein, partial [Allosphingosinicella sp.]